MRSPQSNSSSSTTKFISVLLGIASRPKPTKSPVPQPGVVLGFDALASHSSISKLDLKTTSELSLPDF